MKQEDTTLEIIAPTVDEAISIGCDQLGLPREAVKVEILDAGGKGGIFGLRSRQARVRLRILTEEGQEEAVAEAAPAAADASAEAEPAAVEADSSGVNLDDEKKMILQIATTVLEGLLEKMKVRAKVDASYIENSDEKDEPVLLLDIVGDDLSILIGRRSETLNALQYITNLIVGKELGHWVPLIVDVQGYRIRRERQLRQLAQRMADQAVQAGRRQTLEPMPANERRLIHLELREHPDVTTRSVGEEPYRKVTISLK
jgi:spoIIIJ-associated protein